MPRFLRRIVSLVLIPCLLADPLHAIAKPLLQPSTPHANVPQAFSEQALIPVLAGALFIDPMNSDSFLQVFDYLGAFVGVSLAVLRQQAGEISLKTLSGLIGTATFGVGAYGLYKGAAIESLPGALLLIGTLFLVHFLSDHPTDRKEMDRNKPSRRNILGLFAGVGLAGFMGLRKPVEAQTGPRITAETGLDPDVAKKFLDRFIAEYEAIAQKAIQAGTFNPVEIQALRTFAEHIKRAVRIHQNPFPHAIFSIYRTDASTDAREIVLEMPPLLDWLNEPPSARRDEKTQDIINLAIWHGRLLREFNDDEFNQMAQEGTGFLASTSTQVKSAYAAFLRMVSEHGLLLYSIPTDVARFELQRHVSLGGEISFDPWVGEKVSSFLALMSKIRSGSQDHKRLQWSLMVKEGGQAEFFVEHPRVHSDAVILAAQFPRTAQFNLNNADLRARALQDKNRLENAKHLTARTSYMESVGFERLVDYLIAIGFTAERLRAISESESDASIRGWIERVIPFMELAHLKSVERNYAFRREIFLNEITKNFPAAVNLIWAECVENGSLVLENGKAYERRSIVYPFLTDPRYTDEDHHTDRKPDFAQNAILSPSRPTMRSANGFAVQPLVKIIVSAALVSVGAALLAIATPESLILAASIMAFFVGVPLAALVSARALRHIFKPRTRLKTPFRVGHPRIALADLNPYKPPLKPREVNLLQVPVGTRIRFTATNRTTYLLQIESRGRVRISIKGRPGHYIVLISALQFADKQFPGVVFNNRILHLPDFRYHKGELRLPETTHPQGVENLTVELPTRTSKKPLLMRLFDRGMSMISKSLNRHHLRLIAQAA